MTMLPAHSARGFRVIQADRNTTVAALVFAHKELLISCWRSYQYGLDGRTAGEDWMRAAHPGELALLLSKIKSS